MSAYNLSFAVLLLTGAARGDHFGRRLFVAGLGLFVAASGACALAGSGGWTSLYDGSGYLSHPAGIFW